MRADLEDWELRSARLALDFIQIGKSLDALNVLHQRPSRTMSSPLHAIEIYALYMAGNLTGANDAVDRFLDLAADHSDLTMLVDALMWREAIGYSAQKMAVPIDAMRYYVERVLTMPSCDPGFLMLLRAYLQRASDAGDKSLLEEWLLRSNSAWPAAFELFSDLKRPVFRETDEDSHQFHESGGKLFADPSRPVFSETAASVSHQFRVNGSIVSAMPTGIHSSGNPLDLLTPLIERHVSELKQPGVVSIRPGYRMENDWPTKEPVVVVIKSKDADDISLPTEIEGVKVEVREATPVEELRYQQPDRYAKLADTHSELRTGAFDEIDPVAEGAVAAEQPAVEAAKPQIPYTAAAIALSPVTGKLSFTCHASPDAGWPTLKKFISATQSGLVLGLYDFTSKHILDEVKIALGSGQAFEITLDNPALNPTADQSDSDTVKALSGDLGDSLTAAWALVRSNKAITQWIFPTAYHIKVAVRDGKSMWLSSGNWNNSNQPDMDPINDPQPTDQQTARKSDRDWHVIIDNKELAEQYEAYLRHDYSIASAVAPVGPGTLAAEPVEAMPADFQVEARAAWKFFPPLELTNEPATVTPLLTPDAGVYQPAMLDLIKKSENTLYIQLQYIHPSNQADDQDFNELIGAVAERIGAGVDVKIILSQYQTSNGWLERLQSAGIDLSKVKIQNGVHNKGFVVDTRKVAIGSQNWSGDGVLRNRDASVIIENAKAADYYEKIFLHDWNNVARQSTR